MPTPRSTATPTTRALAEEFLAEAAIDRSKHTGTGSFGVGMSVMKMIALTVAAMTLPFVAGLAPAASAQTRLASPCGSVRGHTLAATAAARVYTVTRRVAFGDKEVDTVACYHGVRPVVIDTGYDCYPDACNIPPTTRIAGRFCAIASDSGGRDGTFTSLSLVDLHKRRKQLVWRSSGDNSATTDLAVTSKGAVGWIDFYESRDGTGNHLGWISEVRSVTPGGGVSLLDRGPDVQPRSLALAGSLLYWITATHARSADLT